jgi:hypothetical protein
LRSDEGKMRRIPKEKFSSSDRQYLEGLMDTQRPDAAQSSEQEAEGTAPEPRPESAEAPAAAAKDDAPSPDWEEEVREVAEQVGGDTQPPRGPEPVEAVPAPEPTQSQSASTPQNSAEETTNQPAHENPPEPADDAAPSASDFAAVTGTGAAETTMDVEPAPGTARQTQAGTPAEAETRKDIPYKTIDEWDLPNQEGGGRRILISPKYANAESLRQLGQQLMAETEEEVYTDIEVFTSVEAAELAKENVRQLSLEDRNAFQRHYVAHYHKNVAQNLIQYELYPARPGAEEVVDLN